MKKIMIFAIAKILIKGGIFHLAVILYRKNNSRYALRFLQFFSGIDWDDDLIDRLNVSPSELMLWTNNNNTADHSIKTWNVASHAKDWFRLLKAAGRSKHRNPKSIGIVAAYPSAIGLYLAVAVVLLQRGHRVTFVYTVNSSHDGLPNNDVNKKMVSLEMEAIKENLPHGLAVINVDEFLPTLDIDDDFMNVVENQSNIDTQTVLRLATPSSSDEYKELYSYRVERNISFASKFNNLLPANQCDLWMVDSGCWAEYGMAYEVLRRAGHKNILCPAFRIERNKIAILRNRTLADLDVDQAWEKVKNEPITRDSQTRVRDMMINTEDPEYYKANSHMVIQRSKRLEIDVLRRDLGLSPKIKVALLMPNCAWDTTLLTEIAHPLFKSHRDWMLETLRYLVQKKDWVVIVRPHPADAIFASTEASAVIVEEFKRNEGIINVIALSSDTEINTYGLMELAEFGLVYSSDVGWEMTLRGKPTIASGRGTFTGKGITYEPKSVDDYYNIIDLATADGLDEERQARVVQTEKFARMFFEDIQKPFPWLPGLLWEDLKRNDMRTMLSTDDSDEFSEAIDILGGGFDGYDGWLGNLQ